MGRIGRQAAVLLIGRVVSQGLALLLALLVAARLGPAGLGGYAVVAAVVYVANMATTFGTDMVLTREIASGNGADGWLPALLVQLGLSACAIGVIWVLTVLAIVPGVATALRVLSLSLVPAAVFSVSAAVLRGSGRMGLLATVTVVTAGLQVALAWVFLGVRGTLPSTMLALLLAQGVGALAAWGAAAAISPAIRRPSRLRLHDVGRMARSGAPIGVLGWLGVVYQRLGVVVLSLVAGPVATGWFASAAKLVEGSKSGHVALFGALYPAMAASHATPEGDGRGEVALTRSLGLSTVAAVLIAAGLLVLGPLAVRHLFGPAFDSASMAVGILGLSVIPSTLATYLTLELVAAHREAATLRALLLSLVVLAVLMAGLIPAIGWLGACWAIVGAETVQAVALGVSRRHLVQPRAVTTRRPLDRRLSVDGVP